MLSTLVNLCIVFAEAKNLKGQQSWQTFHDEIPSVEQAKEAKNGIFLFMCIYVL